MRQRSTTKIERGIRLRDTMGWVASDFAAFIAGAAAGGAAGFIAGPIPALVGAGIGAVAGGLLGHQAVKEQREMSRHLQELDEVGAQLVNPRY